MRTRVVLSVVVMVLLGSLLSSAQDFSPCEQAVTNETQLALAYNRDLFSLPINPPTFQAWLIYPQFIWADFASLPEQFSAAFAESLEQVQGVTVLKVRLTRSLLTGETLVEFLPSTNSISLAAPVGYATNEVDSASRSSLGVWRQYIEWGELDEDILPTLRLDVALADIQDKPAYDAVQEAACAEGSAMTSRRNILMSDSEDSGGDSLLLLSQDGTPCGASKFNKLQVQGTNLFLEWFSITNATYEIVSVTDMTTPASNWVSLASLYPAATGTNLTSFVDVGGAVNTAKFYKVAKTGISILLCDSNSYSGIIDIPLEVGMPSGQELAGVNFLMDGQPTMSIVNPGMSSGFTGSGRWSTLFVSNGWHTLQAFASYADGQNTSGGYSDYSSQIVTVQTANPIVFPDFPTVFGTSLPINALLSSSNASWTVTILSPSNNVLHVFSGSTSNGTISVFWDGNDTNGVSFGGDYVQVQVAASTNGASIFSDDSTLALGSILAMVKVHKGPVGGFPSGFLVSYESFAFSGNNGGALGGFLTMVGAVDDDITAGPYELSGPNSGPNAVDDNASSWSAWKTWLSDGNTANLYYFGHGGPSGVGIQPRLHRGVYDDELGAFLRNGFIADSLLMGHPYRFVFLDGCQTGDGDLCVSFAIDRKSTTAAQYAQRGLPTRAFLGWKYREAYIETNGSGDFSHYHANMITGFFNDWSGGATLKDAINNNIHQGSLLVNTPIIWGDDQLSWNQ